MEYHPLPQPDQIEVRVKEDAMGVVKARNGIFYYFLFFGKMAYHQIYRIRPEKNFSTPGSERLGHIILATMLRLFSLTLIGTGSRLNFRKKY